MQIELLFTSAMFTPISACMLTVVIFDANLSAGGCNPQTHLGLNTGNCCNQLQHLDAVWYTVNSLNCLAIEQLVCDMLMANAAARFACKKDMSLDFQIKGGKHLSSCLLFWALTASIASILPS